MDIDTPLTDIVPETDEEKAAREASEAAAKIEADRIEAERVAEEARIAAEEARLALADSQKPQALRILRADYYLKGRDSELLRKLATLEPEAVAHARSIHDPQIEKIRRDATDRRLVPSGMPQIHAPEKPSKPSKGRK